MSKKNLARTAIEGGRTNYSKNERYQSHRKERAQARDFCYKSLSDEDYAEAHAVKDRPRVRKDFADKLAAMYRWLRSNVGKPWDEVKSKVHELYDSRTTAGRHILYDHLLRSVCYEHEDAIPMRRADFIISHDGILCLADDNRWNRKARARERWESKYPGDWITVKLENLRNWAGMRKVIDYGAVQYWTATPTRVSWRTCYHGYGCYYEQRYVEITEKRYDYRTKAMTESKRNVRHCYAPVDATLAQGVKFNKEEAAFWAKLHPLYKEHVTYVKEDPRKKKR